MTGFIFESMQTIGSTHAIHANTKSLCCTPVTRAMFYVNYISISEKNNVDYWLGIHIHLKCIPVTFNLIFKKIYIW